MGTHIRKEERDVIRKKYDSPELRTGERETVHQTSNTCVLQYKF